MRAVSARLFALFAAMVMLLPSTASARTQYYCRMMGHVVAAAACDNGAAPSAIGPAHQEVESSDCCQRLASSNRSGSVASLDAVSDVAPAAQVATLPHAFAGAAGGGPSGFCAESTQAPLAIGPPLFLMHCAFLS